MNIRIVNIRDVANELAQRYLQQIAAWHHLAWGSITGQQKVEFEDSICAQFRSNSTEYFIAVDTKSQQLIGTISLKQRNMEDEYPDFQWGPWFSGLYVLEQYRHRGISAMLGKTVAELACKKSISKIYYFTHNYSLAPFYQKLQGELIKPVIGDHFSYHNKPILVYAAGTVTVSNIINKYLQNINISYDSQRNEFTSKLSVAPSLKSKL